MNMKALHRRLIASIGLVAACAGTVAAQAITVAGTGDPNVDVPAVQDAVDQGGRVVLIGHFSFDRSPTTPAGETYSRMVTVSKQVVIAGNRDQQGEMPTIEGGFIPFLVEAPSARVAVQGLRFVRPKGTAIWIYAVKGLTIASCRIEGVEASADYSRYAGGAGFLANGIFVGANPTPPSTAQPGQPENFSGTLAILNNDIEMEGTSAGNSLGIVIFGVGKSPDKEVDIYISGNNISNVTEPAINFRIVGGQAHAERNVISTGVTGNTTPDAIRIVGAGSYLIAHNLIDCGWANGAASGINVFGQSATLQEASAIIADNDVTMSTPAGTVFADGTAGIVIGGFAQGNTSLNNRIRGRARAALAVVGRNGGTPSNTRFVSNDLDGLQASLASVFVDAGVANTLVVGRPAGVEDHGSGTVVIPIP